MVKEQLSGVTQKWQDLTGQLDQRDSLIDQAVVKTGQFQDLLRSLSHTTTQLENQLTNHHANSTQPDAVKKQLEDVQNISAQLREERKKLKQAEAINLELSAMVTEDYLKADLARQLESVSKPFKQLEDKAGLVVKLYIITLHFCLVTAAPDSKIINYRNYSYIFQFFYYYFSFFLSYYSYYKAFIIWPFHNFAFKN